MTVNGTARTASRDEAPKTAPTTAMVLAAGLGTRMRPITDTIPKPLVAIAGLPLIDRALDRLSEAGVTRAVVNVHYLADRIEAHLAGRTAPRVAFSDERDGLLETGGGVAKALPLLGPDPFYLLNTDSMWVDGARPLLDRLAERWDGERMDALLAVAPTVASSGYSGTGDFLLDSDGRLSRRPERITAPFVYTGIAILSPALFKTVPDGAFSLNVVFDEAIAAERLFGIRLDGIWMHVGTPPAIAEAEAALAESAL